MFDYITIDFPLSNIGPGRVYAFELITQRYAHEMVKVSFKDWDVNFLSIKPGTPVQCELKSNTSSRMFYGYVHNIETESSPGKNFAELLLIGASYKLKQADQKIYTNVTADQVVKQIADKHGFSYYVEPHPRVYEQIAQAGHTDLELMVRLARQSGYSLRLQNTEIYFSPLMTDYSSMRASAPSFVMTEANSPEGSTIYSFNMLAGESILFEDAFKSAVKVSGVDPFAKTIFSETNKDKLAVTRNISSTEFFDSFATNVVAPTYAIAQSEALAADAKNRFPYRASASVIGDPQLRPDMPVYLTGINKYYDGYWTIISARHKVVETNRNIYTYLTEMELGADSIGGALIWDDGKTISEPTNSARVIIRNENVATITPNSKLTSTTSPVNALEYSGFTEASNRAQNAVTRRYWQSDSSNLKKILFDSNRLPGTIARLRAKNGI
jgi:phage protein D